MKKVNQIFIILFIVFLLIPALTMPFFKNSENTEKRELASKPSLFADGWLNENLGTETEAWLSDHIGFRNALVTANNRLQSAIFKRSAVSSVIIGKDGWLYYAQDLNDYLNVATFTKRNATNIARTYKMVQDALAEEGRSFVFAVAPNKSSLYGDHMPGYYSPLDKKGNIELLNDAFDKYGVCYADLTKGFKSNPEVLYLKTDTHWSYKGALVAWRMIEESIENFSSQNADKQSDRTNDIFGNLSFTKRKDVKGDLAVMLYSTSAEDDIQSYPDMDFSFEYTSHEKNSNALLFTTHNPDGKRNIVMYRDSFGITLHYFVAEVFKNTAFSRVVPYKLSLAQDYEADVVVLEIVERNIDDLPTAAPEMVAPSVSLNLNAAIGNPDQISLFCNKNKEYYHIFGDVDSSLLGEEYRVYVMLDNGEEQNSYEAFPIYETELMETAMKKLSDGKNRNNKQLSSDSESIDNGFSAYIPADMANEKEISIIVESNGKAYYFQKEPQFIYPIIAE